MAVNQAKSVEIAFEPLLGLNTAQAATYLKRGQFRRLLNGYQAKLGSNSKRPGSVPVTDTALGATIEHLTEYQFANSVAVGSAPALTAVGDSASTLAAGTYYARYTFVTDNGETEASAEASVTLPPALVNPTAAPTLAQSVQSGETLADTTYYVAYTWKNAIGETLVSPEASITITAGNKLDVTVPSLPTGATHARIYMGTVSGTLYYQAEVTTTTYSRSTPIDTVTATPVSNTAIATKLRVTVPAVPFHANKTNVYISTTTNTETLQGNTTTTTFDRSTPLVSGAAYPAANTTSFSSELLAVSSDKLYGFYNGALNAAAMTDTFTTPDVYSVAVRNTLLVSALLLTDGGSLKQYNGTSVANVTPASNDASPAPANDLAAINAAGIKYVWVHKGYVFLSGGTDRIYYTKKYEFDYVPSTQFFRYVRNNDYVTGPGVTYNNLMLLPMRRGWGILLGSNFNDGVTADPFKANEYLNTTAGNIAPRGIQRVMYPDGTESIVFLSDDGVHEIYTVAALSSGDRQYSTRSLMKDVIDFEGVGFTDTEKREAVSYFDQTLSCYILAIKRGTERYAYVYDTRTREWYLWNNIKAEAIIRFNGVLYYAGSTGHLHKFDVTLGSDWNEKLKTTGTPIDWDNITDMIPMEDTGYQSVLDYLVVSAKQFVTRSVIDVEIVFASTTHVITGALQNQYGTWDVTEWDNSVFANLDYTDLIGAPPRIPIKKKGYYFQIRFRNNRDELAEMYKYRLIGRISGG